ncbi:MAG: winged helix DNA-binding domain-containing protein [Actinomycetota bacterium]|nr:winged helix DNA-binding domain-containing protein [Actinomycetota bacterium]
MKAKPLVVTQEEARRIAVRAQLLDGSARGVLDTVRRLGFLQMDPIAVVARPQHLVLWSRLGNFDITDLERLLWVERKLFEWDAFIWPMESLPLVRALMRRNRRGGTLGYQRRGQDFLEENSAFRRYVMRELERRGPLLGRELDDPLQSSRPRHRWWGNRRVGLMMDILQARGHIAVAGRCGGHRLWDIAERWYPTTETLPIAQAERALQEQRFRALGVRLHKGRWHAHPEVGDAPVPERVTLLSPFDRLVHDRDRAEALFGFRYRLEMYVPKEKREYGYYVLPLLVGDRLVGRVEPRFDRKTGTLELVGAWGDTTRLDEAMADLAVFLDHKK